MAIIDNFTKEELEKIVKKSNSIKEVIDSLGYSTHSGDNNKTIKNRLAELDIDYSHFKHKKGIERNEENVFIKDSTASQATLRRWYIKGKYSPYICSVCGLEPFWQGKELTLILDHINGHNHDDRLENLRWVCPNCNQQLPTTGNRKKTSIIAKPLKIKKTKENKKYFCSTCGKEITTNANNCVECSHLLNRTVIDRPSREELKQLIRTNPFTTIGSMFHVSDNAVRKWCDSYHLPRTKKEINSYTEEEWLII